MKSLFLSLCACLLLSACATGANDVDAAVGANQPQAYKSGYKGGCDSGYVAAGHPYYKFSKDVKAYAKDSLYKQGWDDGFAVCKGKYNAIQNAY